MSKETTNTAPAGTSTLLRRLLKATDLRSFLTENERSLTVPTFPAYLDALCRERSLVREHVILRAGIERSFGHQLFRGARKPSRDNVLRLAFGFGLTVDETQTLLRLARKALLYPKIPRDAAILYSLSQGDTIVEAQASLCDLGLSILGGEKYEHAER